MYSLELPMMDGKTVQNMFCSDILLNSIYIKRILFMIRCRVTQKMWILSRVRNTNNDTFQACFTFMSRFSSVCCGVETHFQSFWFCGLHLVYDLCNESGSGAFCVWHFTLHPFHKVSNPPPTHTHTHTHLSCPQVCRNSNSSLLTKV